MYARVKACADTREGYTADYLPVLKKVDKYRIVELEQVLIYISDHVLQSDYITLTLNH